MEMEQLRAHQACIIVFSKWLARQARHFVIPQVLVLRCRQLLSEGSGSCSDPRDHYGSRRLSSRIFTHIKCRLWARPHARTTHSLFNAYRGAFRR